MSDWEMADDGIFRRARRLARRAWDYLRSDEARSRIDGARRKAVEVGGMAKAKVGGLLARTGWDGRDAGNAPAKFGLGIPVEGEARVDLGLDDEIGNGKHKLREGGLSEISGPLSVSDRLSGHSRAGLIATLSRTRFAAWCRAALSRTTDGLGAVGLLVVICTIPGVFVLGFIRGLLEPTEEARIPDPAPPAEVRAPEPAHEPVLNLPDEAEQERIEVFQTWVSLSAKDRRRAAEAMPIDAAFRRQSGSYDPAMQPLLHGGLLSQLHEQTKRIIAETFEITPEGLDAIIEEGKAKRWPGAESLGGH